MAGERGDSTERAEVMEEKESQKQDEVNTVKGEADPRDKVGEAYRKERSLICKDDDVGV